MPELDIQVLGFVGTTMRHSNTYTVNNSGPSLINFDYTGIESVGFTSSEEPFAMDNLAVTIPEPESFKLLLLFMALAWPGILWLRPACLS